MDNVDTIKKNGKYNSGHQSFLLKQPKEVTSISSSSILMVAVFSQNFKKVTGACLSIAFLPVYILMSIYSANVSGDSSHATTIVGNGEKKCD